MKASLASIQSTKIKLVINAVNEIKFSLMTRFLTFFRLISTISFRHFSKISLKQVWKQTFEICVKNIFKMLSRGENLYHRNTQKVCKTFIALPFPFRDNRINSDMMAIAFKMQKMYFCFCYFLIIFGILLKLKIRNTMKIKEKRFNIIFLLLKYYNIIQYNTLTTTFPDF